MSERVYAVLTGDLVNYSQLEDSDRSDYVNCLREILNSLEEKNLIFDIFRGDSFQAVLPSSREALTAALIIRSYIVSRTLSSKKKIRPDVRIAIGVGSIDTYNEQNISSSDGEAFRNSGPELDRMDKKRQRVTIKTNWPVVNGELKTECFLLDAITSKWTASQAEAVYYTLSGKNQIETATILHIAQGNVSSKLSSANFDAVRVMIDRYKQLIDGCDQ
ncbi:SatD family protein [Methanogenium sp. MK-MG]|uniref:SatD family protein n=1 Tax=Methanogenium sp. MK-MG TaxID=2599926 RepID=UPI0013ED4C1B|nr:SatD family protein [Methanogenium sp. MK-MG]KAF1073434.1 hypothetical protein MKMG_02161 [Methanogenium sp. MK-MG]